MRLLSHFYFFIFLYLVACCFFPWPNNNVNSFASIRLLHKKNNITQGIKRGYRQTETCVIRLITQMW